MRVAPAFIESPLAAERGVVLTMEGSDVSASGSGRAPGVAVGSAGHTAGLLLALLVLSVLGAVRSPMSVWPQELSRPGARPLLYLRIVVLQWVWAAYVWFGVRRAGGSLRALIDASPWTARRWLQYATVGVGGFISWLVLGAGLGAILRPSAEQLRGLQSMLPQTPQERLLWIGFVLSAAFCEEVVYRGYLFRQFRAVTGSALAAVVLQAAAYGAAHLALPIEMVASVGLLGLLLGAIAVWRKSLVPVMILHAGTGLMAIAASRP